MVCYSEIVPCLLDVLEWMSIGFVAFASYLAILFFMFAVEDMDDMTDLGYDNLVEVEMQMVKSAMLFALLRKLIMIGVG